jgi:hypothetical protein
MDQLKQKNHGNLKEKKRTLKETKKDDKGKISTDQI